MKKIISFALLLTVFFSCSEENILNETVENLNDVDAIIENKLHQNNQVFNWNMVDTDVLWAAIEQGDYIVTVGYSNDYDMETASQPETQKEQLLQKIINSENELSGNTLERTDILIKESRELTYFDVFIRHRATLELLEAETDIRYLEPGNYIFKKQTVQTNRSDSGCGTDAQSISPEDYTVVPPAAWVPWNFYKHNIPQAWNHSTGDNIKVGVIDTGISPDQDNFSSDFNSGYSSGRTAQKDGMYVSSWWAWADPDGPDDDCGHGTSMAAMVAAPRNGENVPTGVAYNCNLFTVRGTGDVVLDGYSEQDGVADAITFLAKKSSLKIISMSLGNVISVGKIEDAVKFAVNKKGKLFFAAGGTSTSYTTWYGVIFPASMDETVAVTGVTDANNYEACAVCHEGSEIDFTIVMQRAGDADRKSVCLGYSGNTANYLGGSSVATATTAGIAALVWAQHPSWKANKVLNKMKESTEFYPNRHSSFGWGNIDALQAVQ